MRQLSSWVAVLAALGLVAVGCQKSSSGPQAADYQKQRAAVIEKQKQAQAGSVEAKAPEAPEAELSVEAESEQAFVYDPIGKRDPFRSFILDRVNEADASEKGPLERFDLSQLSVTGVVWKVDDKRALVTDPSGQAYIVKEGDPIGKNDGRIIAIDDSVMLVREAYVDFHGEKTTKEIEMRVRQSQGG